MARVDVDQADVVLSVVEHLRTELGERGLNERTCFMVVDAGDPPPHIVASEDNWFVVVSPGPGQFDAGLFFGGGAEQTMEAFTIVCGIYSRILTDEAGHDVEALTRDARGILRLKKWVLEALADTDLQIGGNEFQRETWRPVAAGQPRHVGLTAPGGREMEGGTTMTQLLLSFQTGFDWDLESAYDPVEESESTSV